MPPDADELSCEACSACGHPKAFHRPNNGACFGELDRNRPSHSAIADIEQRKKIGAECWCPAYKTDNVDGVESVLKYGNRAALQASADAALERGDFLSAERLRYAYVRKTPQIERDTEWLGAIDRSIERRKSHSAEQPPTPKQPFRLEDLDHRILSYKTSEIANEMHGRAAEAQRRIAYESAQRGNSAGYWPELAAFHVKLADEWAEKIYAAHCETLGLQGQPVTPEFIRAVRDSPIANLFAARRSSVVVDMLDACSDRCRERQRP